MIRRITLDNYMAHGRTVIEPAAGLTVLVGPNNCGKSAVVHALLTLCYNRPAEFAVRHGEKEAAVTVETDDGHTLTWRRRKGVVSYVIDGREVHRLGQGGVPDDLHEYLRMPKIESGESTPFLLHFGLQKSPIFLLDDSPGRAATFFASSSDAERLLEMQKRHREKVRDARRDHARVAAECEALQRHVAALSPVGEINRDLTAANRWRSDLLEAQRRLSDLAGHSTKMASAAENERKRRAVGAALEPLSAPPQQEDLRPLDRHIRNMREVLRRAVIQRGRQSALRDLPALPSLQDETRLRQHIIALGAAAQGVRLALERSVALAELRASPQTAESTGVDRAVQSLRAAQRQRNRAAARLTAIQELNVLPTVVETEPLRLIAANLTERRRKVDECRRRVARHAAELEQVRQAAAEWAAENPQCPLCGATTDAETVLVGGHAHV